MAIESLEELNLGDLIKYGFTSQLEKGAPWNYAVVTFIEGGPGSPPDISGKVVNFKTFYDRTKGNPAFGCISDRHSGLRFSEIRVERAKIEEVKGKVVGIKRYEVEGGPDSTRIELPDWTSL